MAIQRHRPAAAGSAGADALLYRETQEQRLERARADERRIEAGLDPAARIETLRLTPADRWFGVEPGGLYAEFCILQQADRPQAEGRWPSI